MIEALLIAAAKPAMTAIEAERAFAADAQKSGQWTAFRKYAADEAMMFVPHPTNAQEWLKDKADPAKSVEWQAITSFTSCDGVVAATYGPWRRPDGSEGNFFTIWEQRRIDGRTAWRWVFDAGVRYDQALTVRTPPIERKASCVAVPPEKQPTGLAMPASTHSPGTHNGNGASPDRSLAWVWAYTKDQGTWLHVEMWNGNEFKTVMDVQAAAP